MSSGNHEGIITRNPRRLPARKYDILQVNLGKCHKAHLELTDWMSRTEVDVALVQEPYTGASNQALGICGYTVVQNGDLNNRNKTAIYIRNTARISFTHLSHLGNPNVCPVELKLEGQENIVMVSCYVEPEDEVGIPNLRFLEQKILGLRKRKIICGDFNARSISWGDRVNSRRGNEVEEILNFHDLILANNGNTPTFERILNQRYINSFIDLTMISPQILPKILDWKVNLEAVHSSDHNAISFTIKDILSKKPMAKSTRKYDTQKIPDQQWDFFRDQLKHAIEDNGITSAAVKDIQTHDDLEDITIRITQVLTSTCKKVFPKRRKAKRPGAPWMTDEVLQAKDKVKRCKIVLQKKKRQGFPIDDQDILRLRSAKESYARILQETNTDSFKQKVAECDIRDPWDFVNKVVKGRTQQLPDTLLRFPSGYPSNEKENAEKILAHFYEEDRSRVSKEIQARLDNIQDDVYARRTGNDCPFTADELFERIDSMDPKKAPGQDGLTADICKEIVVGFPEIMTNIFNKCLDLGYFPRIWKVAVCKLIPKPMKPDYGRIESWRPLGLLAVLGKILEALFIRRIRYFLSTKEIMHDDQYGFTEQTSTVDALTAIIDEIKHQSRVNRNNVFLISLDIQGAFNNAKWPVIIKRLYDYRVPANLISLTKSYLQDRIVVYPVSGGYVERHVNQGCIQGSVGGPEFWNLILNDIFAINLPKGCKLRAFADDISLVVWGKKCLETRNKASEALKMIQDWGLRNGLTFNPGKTQCVAVSRKLRNPEFSPEMNGIRIPVMKEVKILGVIIDQDLKFSRHILDTISKAQVVWQKLYRITRISWGASPEILMLIYTSAIEPIITYACPIWKDGIRSRKIKKELNAFQRKHAQAIAKAYRTSSLNSTLALANIPPLDLKIDMLCAVERAKKSLRCPELSSGNPNLSTSSPAEGSSAHQDILQGNVHWKSLPHPARRVRISYNEAETQDELEDLLGDQQLAYFTDGSKTSDGKIGAAWTYRKIRCSNPDDGRKTSLKLGRNCTVFQAELAAIKSAIKDGLRLAASNNQVSTVKILCTDSKASLEALKDRSSKNPQVFLIQNLIRKSLEENLTWKFVWVRAHGNIEGNEKADQFAKESANNDNLIPSYSKYPLSQVKKTYQDILLGKWNERYLTDPHGKITRTYIPSISWAAKVWTAAKPSFLTSQILTGHGAFKKYLCDRKFTQDPSCNLCGLNLPQDADHILNACDFFAGERDICRIRYNYHLYNQDEDNAILVFMDFASSIMTKVYNKNSTLRTPRHL